MSATQSNSLHYYYDPETGAFTHVDVAKGANSTELAPAADLVNPRWDGAAWVSGGAVPDKGANEPISHPDELDRLRVELNALQGGADFRDDLLQELALVLFGEDVEEAADDEISLFEV